MTIEWFEKLILEYLKEMSIKERLQLIQKIAELSVQELTMLEAEKQRETP